MSPDSCHTTGAKPDTPYAGHASQLCPSAVVENAPQRASVGVERPKRMHPPPSLAHHSQVLPGKETGAESSHHQDSAGGAAENAQFMSTRKALNAEPPLGGDQTPGVGSGINTPNKPLRGLKSNGTPQATRVPKTSMRPPCSATRCLMSRSRCNLAASRVPRRIALRILAMCGSDSSAPWRAETPQIGSVPPDLALRDRNVHV